MYNVYMSMYTYVSANAKCIDRKWVPEVIKILRRKFIIKQQ